MKPERLKEWIKAYSPLTEVNSFGEKIQSWKLEGEWRAEEMSYQGSALRELSEVFAEGRISFGIRCYHSPKETWQIEYRGNRYSIDSIRRDRDNGRLILGCVQINP